MAEVCICGNKLGEREYTLRVSPCRCASPGLGPRVARAFEEVPDYVSPQQYAERKRLGLPVVTDIERSAFGDRRWR